MSKKFFQISVATSALLPIFLGMLGMLNGAQNFMTEEEMSASLDSNIRFHSAIFCTYGLLFYWILPNIDRCTGQFRIMMVGLFLGGLVRIYSIYKFGVPAGLIQLLLVLELLLPVIFIPWQTAVAKGQYRASGPPTSLHRKTSKIKRGGC